MIVGADGLVVLYDVEGHAHKRMPIDARTMLERGGYTTDQPANAIDSVTVSATPEPRALRNGDIGPTGATVVVGARVDPAVAAAHRASVAKVSKK